MYNPESNVPYNYFTGSYGNVFAPVPIGIITFGLVALLNVFSTKEKRHAISKETLILLLFIIFFILLSTLNIGAIRTLMLLFPFWCMYFVIVLTKNMRAYEKISSGYVVSFLFFVSLHFFCTLYSYINGMNNSFVLFNSIFSIQIYQALVSYSAVLSYAAITLTIFTAYKSNYLQKIPVYFFVFIILFLLSLGKRKAVLLDIGILFSLYVLFEFIRIKLTLKIKKIHGVILILCPIFLFVLLTFSGFSERDISWGEIVKQRGHHYTIFFNLMAHADFLQLLFGHGGSWGGFSNIYLEIVYRLGILGFLLYVISFLIGLIIIRKHIKNLFNFNSYNVYFAIWFWFTILTVFLSNGFNMNLQLPYYSMNIVMIMMTFLHRTKTISTKS